MKRKFKNLTEALYADSDYLTELANKPSMREYCQDIIDATVDINRAAFELGSKEEFILDKIRAEIEQGYCKVENDYDKGRNMGLHIAMQIIDKYREVSE